MTEEERKMPSQPEQSKVQKEGRVPEARETMPNSPHHKISSSSRLFLFLFLSLSLFLFQA